MTVLYDPNPNPTGKWGWWGDPNVTDEMIVDYEMRNPRLPTGPRQPRWGEPGHEPWQRFPGPLTLPLPNPTPRQVDPNEIFNPFGFPGGLAGKYMSMGMNNPPLWAGALGGLLGAGFNLFSKRK